VARLEAALGLALARHAPRRQRLGKSLQPLGAEIVEIEQAANQPARGGADHHAARRGERLQPRRHVRHLTNHRPLARLVAADQVADHYQAGRDPDPRLQPHGGLQLQSRDFFDQDEPGAHGLLGVVLMRDRPPEISEHAVDTSRRDLRTARPLWQRSPGTRP
jgi:hypothetical protein